MTRAAMKSGQRSAPPVQRSKPQRSITALYTEFEAAHQKFRKAWATLQTVGDLNVDGPENKSFSRACTKSNKIANQLVRTPAASMGEIMLKLRVVAWQEADISLEDSRLCSTRPLEDFDQWLARGKPGPDRERAVHILAELQADLRRAAAH